MQVFHIETDLTSFDFSGNLKNVCRTCLEKRDHLINMFLKHKKSHKTYAEMLMAFTPVNITENDEYSVNICDPCAEIIESVYDFQQQCLQIDAILRFATVNTEDVQESVEDGRSIEPIQKEEVREYKTVDKIIEDVEDGSSVKIEHEDNENYKCCVCFDNFPNENSLQEHLSVQHKLEPVEFVNSEQCIKETIVKVQDSSPAKTELLVCEICGKQCSNIGNFKRHQKIHTDDKQYSCEYCAKKFIQKVALNEHLCTHTDNMEYACVKCDKHFKTKRRLKRHEMKLHVSPKVTVVTAPEDKTHQTVYCCTKCRQAFNTRQDWSFHMKTHPVKRLKTHKLATHSSGERLFQCTECGKRFLQRIVLENHILTHTGVKPFKCRYCEKTFRQRAHVQSHELIHTGEKPYKCEFCTKQFRHQNTLIHHTRTHTGETPFRCSQCNKGFYHLSNMKKHMKNTKNCCAFHFVNV